MANQRDCVFWNYCVRVLVVIYVAIAVRYGFVLFFFSLISLLYLRVRLTWRRSRTTLKTKSFLEQ